MYVYRSCSGMLRTCMRVQVYVCVVASTRSMCVCVDVWCARKTAVLQLLCSLVQRVCTCCLLERPCKWRMCQLSSTAWRTGSCLLNTSGHMPRRALAAPGTSYDLQSTQEMAFGVCNTHCMHTQFLCMHRMQAQQSHARAARQGSRGPSWVCL